MRLRGRRLAAIKHGNPTGNTSGLICGHRPGGAGDSPRPWWLAPSAGGRAYLGLACAGSLCESGMRRPEAQRTQAEGQALHPGHRRPRWASQGDPVLRRPAAAIPDMRASLGPQYLTMFLITLSARASFSRPMERWAPMAGKGMPASCRLARAHQRVGAACWADGGALHHNDRPGCHHRQCLL